MKILLVGMNHRTAPVEVRERFAVDDPLPWLAKLVESPEVDEAVLISTCNRVEVIAAAPNLDAGRHRLRSFFHRELGQAAALPQGRSESAVLYEHVDGDAVRHLFRVAASIDSLVVGEPQILGQVKDAYRVAAEGGTCGPLLNRLFASAFAASKRVRNETEIASRPISMARVAVDLARQIFETLEDKRALLIGAGEMIEMALDALRGAGLAAVAVANRTPERAGELAVRYGASAHGLDELPALLATSDVVLTSIGADRPLLDAALFEDALRARRRQPIFAIDLGVPRNIDPAVNQLDDVYLYDVDDLGGVAESNAEERRRETVLRRGDRAGGGRALERLALGAASSADDPAPALARGVDPPERARQGDRPARSRREPAARRRGADARVGQQGAARARLATARAGGARRRPRVPRGGEGALRARRSGRTGRRGGFARRRRPERRRVVVVKRLRLATRGSQLALAQSGQIARRVEEQLGVGVELVTVRTSGDRLADVSLAKIGGKGLFVKELEEALLDGRADFAVHSAKDLPAKTADGPGARGVPRTRGSARRAGRARLRRDAVARACPTARASVPAVRGAVRSSPRCARISRSTRCAAT